MIGYSVKKVKTQSSKNSFTQKSQKINLFWNDTFVE